MGMRRIWTAAWMRMGGRGRWGRLAMGIAGWSFPPYYARHALARRYACGYFAPSAQLAHPKLHLGKHVYLDERVLIYGDKGGGPVRLGEGVHVHRDTLMQTGAGGAISVGKGTSIQARCVFSAYVGPLNIGSQVQIAPQCGFYSYNHAIGDGDAIHAQPLQTRGGIQVDDDVWIGFGACVLDGVHIGAGAVVAAGAVVTRSVPAGAVVAGSPARVVKQRARAPVPAPTPIRRR